MNKVIYTTFAEDTGITVILEDTRTADGDTVSTEIKGFYHGSPNEADTKEFYGKIKAEYISGTFNQYNQYDEQRAMITAATSICVGKERGKTMFLVELDDKKNINLIKQALKDYEDGALLEARDALAEVVKNIDDFDLATRAAE